MAWSSSARPLTRIRASVKAVPSVGENSVSLSPGSRSPGYTRYRAVAPAVEVSCWPAVSTANAVTANSPLVGRSTPSVQVVLVAPGEARLASRVAKAAAMVPFGCT